MIKTIRKLCALSGVSGCEDEVRAFLRAQAEGCGARVETDILGNLYAWKKGVKPLAPPVMLCAHMDEVGLIVTGYREDGTLRFDFVGGVDRRVVIGKPVTLGAEKRPGVIGLKPIHLTGAQELERVPGTDELCIDIGACSAHEAGELVALGCCGAFDGRVVSFGEGYIKAKALDDRVGCAALLELLRETPPVDVCCVFTVQEEVGSRGAQVAARRVQPALALAVEGTSAADLPGVEPGQQVCRLGEGVVIPFIDQGTLYETRLVRQAISAAERRGILWQSKERSAGSTDAAALQRSGTGVGVLTLSAPLRGIHSPASVGKESDLLLLPRLIHAVLEDVSDGSFVL